MCILYVFLPFFGAFVSQKCPMERFEKIFRGRKMKKEKENFCKDYDKYR